MHHPSGWCKHYYASFIEWGNGAFALTQQNKHKITYLNAEKLSRFTFIPAKRFWHKESL